MRVIHRVLASFVLAAVMPGASSGLPPAPPPRSVDPQDVDQTTLTGNWKLVSIDSEGNVLSGKKLVNSSLSAYLTVDGKSGTFRRGMGSFVSSSKEEGEFKIVKAVPEGLRIQLHFTQFHVTDVRPKGMESKETAREIWELDGKDRIQITVGTGDSWPTAGATKKGDGRVILIYERLKP